MTEISLPILSIKHETADVTSILLDTKGKDIPYQAGQFFKLTLPDVLADPRGPSRFFSNSSSPTERDFFMFTTKISQSPFKQKVKTLKAGDTVLVEGPFGKFTLSADSGKLHVMLAGGIGMTPLRAMAKYATDMKLPHKMILFYSSHVPEGIIFSNDLPILESKNPNFRVVYTVTHPEESKTPWTGKVGRVSEALIREYVTDLSNAIFYICGPPSMVDDLTSLVKAMGVSEENLKTERFTGYE